MGIFKRLDHVSIGVSDMDAAKRLFLDVFGGEPMNDVGSNERENFEWFTFRLGGKKLELVAPLSPGEGGVGRFLAKRGEGFHHLSIAVDNLDEAIRHFESRGLRVLAPNAVNPLWKHFYLHPQDTHGALIQVFEENEKTIADSQ